MATAAGEAELAAAGQHFAGPEEGAGEEGAVLEEEFTARLQAATGSHKPILLRVDFDAGHGIGSTRAQGDREAADTYAFLLWQTGVKGYQPA